MQYRRSKNDGTPYFFLVVDCRRAGGSVWRNKRGVVGKADKVECIHAAKMQRTPGKYADKSGDSEKYDNTLLVIGRVNLNKEIRL